ncbi:hypothetical protein V6N13_065617 [Hibiscus sabdariffa]|uniref:Uncharacterized protein n=1 Tax=Hibiscus sabdariffa TaxID=183260 RepID=A0ABR2QQC0_9ROSI
MVDFEISRNPKNSISSQRLYPSGRPPDGLDQTMFVAEMRGINRKADQKVVLVDEQMELEMTHMINGDVDDGVTSGRPSPPTASTASMKVSFKDMVTENLDNQQRNNFIAYIDMELLADDVVIDLGGGVGSIDPIEIGREVETVATGDKVVTASTALHVDKHTTVRVVEEGSKQPVLDSSRKAMYGLIRKVGSKSSSRNPSIAVGLTRKNGKGRKGDEVNNKQVVASDWASNLASNLIKSGITTEHGNVQGRGKASQVKPNVQWINNHTYVGDERNLVQ